MPIHKVSGPSRSIILAVFRAASRFLPLFFLLLLPRPLYANNASVTNVSLVEQDQSANTIKVEFDLSWDNAWSDSINKDAVWVFVKYCTSSCGTIPAAWSHAILKTSGTNPSGFTRGTKGTTAFDTLDIVVPSDKMGAFIQPSHQGSGTVQFTDLQLVWDYGANGLSDATASGSSVTVEVFAIEMVYIPEEGFYAGDGGTGNAQFEMGDGTQDLPATVNSEGGITFRNDSSGSYTNAYWFYNSDNNGYDEPDGAPFDVSEAFPKGFHAFYLMKHQIPEDLYVSFLNNLTSAQASARFPNQFGNDRHRVTVSGGTYSTDRPGRSCGYLSWMDVAAIADWAALRPITELEYEKAARGPLAPVAGEYAWGTTSYTSCDTLSGAEDGTATCTSGNVNFGNTTFTGGDGGAGPLRVGILATSSTTTREEAGAGYYGNLGLSGNLAELTVTLGATAGRAFSGTHGDGTLDSDGDATNDDWPGFVSGSGVTTGNGSGERGGSWLDTQTERITVSDRYNAADGLSTRENDRGGRLGRTAP
ncbi:MAG TPA: SUMF1/EgtB/PvdO family nonheme iron enzyme [Verrucomicrobiae bacterium]|nr:SUMF1/EgtB/PvdO family nonheme iron enzyme [Verrucomicrobiae bacterium]